MDVSTSTSTSTAPSIEEHPDIVTMRLRSERATTGAVAQAAEALGVLCGVYLAASPWIVGFNGFTTLTTNNLITGVALALLMMGAFGSAYERTHAMSWAAFAIGVWTIIAPWAVSGSFDTTRTITNNVIVGGVACLMALVLALKGVIGIRRL
ncbi:SPW repeat protein [Embleya scabrispora]|uniref:SPW repeat protein n=1 Tax=Embleya scabrispora TaxID=159449 RepID=UPI0039C89B3D